MHADSFTAPVPPHGVKLVRVFLGGPRPE
jgi:hypothetical protein